MRARHLALLAKFAVIAAWTYAGAAPAIEPDALERPATISARASGAVLLAVTRVDQRLVAVGERGIILFSDDGGYSWKQAQVPVSVSLTNVTFANSRKGWAVGHSGVVLHTTDAGASWARQLDGRQAARLILMAAEKEASVRNDAEVQAQAQARLREARRIASEGPDKPFFAVHFLDEQRGFIVGAYGLFFSTIDGGLTWEPCHSRIDNPEGKHLYSVGASGASVYIAGEQGALYHSADAGRTFTALKTPYAGSYFGLTLFGNGDLLIYGLKGHAFRSDGEMHRWRRVETGTQAGLTAAFPLTDGSVVMVTQAGEVLRGSADGQTVQPMPVPRRFPFSGITQAWQARQVTSAADADLILSGVRGITRVPVGQQK